MAKAEPRSITRRFLLAALAVPAVPVLPPDFAAAASGLPPLPIAPPPPPPDPVFAAIEAHLRAYKDFIAVLDDLAAAEQVAWHAPRGQRRAAKKRLAGARVAERRFAARETEAIDRLLGTVPQTLHGATAVLRYVREWLEEGHLLEEEDHIALIRSIECAIVMERRGPRHLVKRETVQAEAG